MKTKIKSHWECTKFNESLPLKSLKHWEATGEDFFSSMNSLSEAACDFDDENPYHRALMSPHCDAQSMQKIYFVMNGCNLFLEATASICVSSLCCPWIEFDKFLMHVLNEEWSICHTVVTVLSSTQDTGSGEMKISATSRII